MSAFPSVADGVHVITSDTICSLYEVFADSGEKHDSETYGLGGKSVALASRKFNGCVVMDSARRRNVERILNQYLTVHQYYSLEVEINKRIYSTVNVHDNLNMQLCNRVLVQKIMIGSGPKPDGQQLRIKSNKFVNLTHVFYIIT